ncbi:MAG TPA: hypothetical protein VIG72_07140 [Pontibacter sp.]
MQKLASYTRRDSWYKRNTAEQEWEYKSGEVIACQSIARYTYSWCKYKL